MQLVLQLVAQVRQARRTPPAISLLADRARLAEADDARNVQRAGAHAALVAAAVHLRGELHARILAPDVERADALGSVDLVAGERQQVDVVCDHVDRNFADRLRGVGVEQDAALLADLADFATGWITPISLLAYMMLTRIVLSVMRFAQHVEVDQAVRLARADR